MAGFGLAFLTHDRMNARWLNWDTSNAELGVDELTGTVMRLALLATAAVLIAAFLAVVPSRRTWYSDLGAATLYGYLLHGFLTRLFTFEGGTTSPGSTPSRASCRWWPPASPRSRC